MPEPSSMGASGTISGTLSGTLLYMPPEILRGETATSASDVFSLGAFLYELTAGQHPFAGETPLDVFEAIECRPVAAIGSLRSGVPREVDRLILRMLDRRPEDRPSAREVCDVLGRVQRAGKSLDRAAIHASSPVTKTWGPYWKGPGDKFDLAQLLWGRSRTNSATLLLLSGDRVPQIDLHRQIRRGHGLVGILHLILAL